MDRHIFRADNSTAAASCVMCGIGYLAYSHHPHRCPSNPLPDIDALIDKALDWQVRALIEAYFESYFESMAKGKNLKVVITQELLDKHKRLAAEDIKELLSGRSAQK